MYEDAHLEMAYEDRFVVEDDVWDTQEYDWDEESCEGCGDCDECAVDA